MRCEVSDKPKLPLNLLITLLWYRLNRNVWHLASGCHGASGLKESEFFQYQMIQIIANMFQAHKENSQNSAFSHDLAQALLQSEYLSWKRTADTGVDTTWFGRRGGVGEFYMYTVGLAKSKVVKLTTKFRDLSKSFQRDLQIPIKPHSVRRAFEKRDGESHKIIIFQEDNFMVWIASILASASTPNSFSRTVNPIQNLYRRFQRL